MHTAVGLLHTAAAAHSTCTQSEMCAVTDSSPVTRPATGGVLITRLYLSLWASKWRSAPSRLLRGKEKSHYCQQLSASHTPRVFGLQ